MIPINRHQYTAVESDLPSPFLRINTMKTYPEFRMAAHSHPFYHINRIIDGSLTVTVAQKSYVLDAGCMFILPPHIPHSLYSPKGYWQIGADVADCEGASGLCAEIRAQCKGAFVSAKLPLSQQVATERAARMEYLLKAPTARHRLRAAHLAEGQILDLLDHLCREHEHSFLDRFTKMTQDTNIWSLQLSDMCRILSLSRTQLERQAHTTFGCGASEYCARLRYAKICELLMGEETLEWIAEQTGFCDASHLSKFFCARAGISPGKYRKIQKGYL